LSELSFPLQDEVFIEDVECVGRQRGRYVTVTPQRELFLESEVDVGDVPGPKFVQTTDLDVPGRPVGTDLAVEVRQRVPFPAEHVGHDIEPPGTAWRDRITARADQIGESRSLEIDQDRLVSAAR